MEHPPNLPVGLKNDGLTCHLLTILQLLAASHVFVSRVTAHCRHELKRVFDHVTRRTRDHTSITRLMLSLDIPIHHPGDAVETLRKIIDFADRSSSNSSLPHTEQNKCLPVKADRTTDRGVMALRPGRATPADHSLWRGLSTHAIRTNQLRRPYNIAGSGTFGMYNIYAVDKETCTEFENVLMLPRHGRTLESCLNAYFDIEHIEDSNKYIARKFFVLPRLLAIHIATPLDTHERNSLEYPHILDLAPYCATTYDHVLEASYNLIGVACYVGHDLDIGHFYARVRRNETWFVVDDHKVHADASNGLGDKHTILYLYEKRV